MGERREGRPTYLYVHWSMAVARNDHLQVAQRGRIQHTVMTRAGWHLLVRRLQSTHFEHVPTKRDDKG